MCFWGKSEVDEEGIEMSKKPFFYMIKEHPTLDLIMIQVDNNAIQLNAERQRRLYDYLKKRLEAE